MRPQEVLFYFNLQSLLTETLLNRAALHSFHYHPPPTSLVVSFPVLSSHTIKVEKGSDALNCGDYVFETCDCCVTNLWQKDHKQNENICSVKMTLHESQYIFTHESHFPAPHPAYGMF